MERRSIISDRDRAREELYRAIVKQDELEKKLKDSECEVGKSLSQTINLICISSV